ncbi:MAG: pyroglutamyl-peptidase I [Xanthomonadales bacterium]|jgi:pyroglutamyl-peptidase|nr:pyroglutamyl-peptidase I [Xanthomonadales bacterium]
MILLTGFTPFGGDAVNPSWEVARAFAGRRIGGLPVATVQLPTTFAGAPRVLRRALREFDPQLTLCLGLARGRRALSLERVAINLIDARIPDNAGLQPIDRPVRRRGAPAHFSPLPLKRMQAAVQAAGIPCELSLSAGSFVCNAVLYHLLAEGAHGGFLHLPDVAGYLPEGLDVPTVPFDEVVIGVERMLVAALDPGADLRVVGGAVC